MLIKQFDKLSEVGKRASQPIDLIDQNDINLAVPHVIEQSLQRWPVEGCAREPAIVKMIGNQPPALMSLTLDIAPTSQASRCRIK